MIRCYTGVPGSGKSLHSIRLICAYLEDGKNVIANFPLRVNNLKNMHGHYYFVSNDSITTDYLMAFSKLYHRMDCENQTLLLIDEASVKFNCRTYNDPDRLKFLSFMAQHRKYGYNIVLVCQNMRQLDRQIRDQVEIEVHHRKANNFRLYKWLPFNLFIAIERNVDIHEKNEHEFFLYSKKYGSLYDTFYEFDSSIIKQPDKTLALAIKKSELIPRCHADLKKQVGTARRISGWPRRGPETAGQRPTT
ncbi:MAG: zonular occludens toxin domain-containing protein [Eubacteriaceae bacterium]|nr:zonular occludens toxin domain-containing protein [Eubacteriaceae bacterium]